MLRAVSANLGHLDVMTVEECLGHLEREPLGRLCVLVDGIPKAFPVNYRLGVGPDRELTIMIATHRGSMIEVADGIVSFEIDGIDKHDPSGWSVMAVGRLFHGESLTEEPHPWISGDDWTWLVLAVAEVTGRKLAHGITEWPFRLAGYL